MKLFRYRKPSLRQLTGYTTLKRRVRRSIGISQLEGFTKPSRIKQHLKEKVGLYSPTMTVIRQTSKGKLPSFLGIFSRRK